jgi:flagellar motor switch protein FliN/FliY
MGENEDKEINEESMGDDSEEKTEEDDMNWNENEEEESQGGALDKTEDSIAETEFRSVKKNTNQSDKKNLDFLLDIPLQVTVELGRTKMQVNDLLQLGQGSVIDLNKLAGEPMEVLVNDKLMARGEVVVVNEKFGIRLTDIVSPTERVEYLK